MVLGRYQPTWPLAVPEMQGRPSCAQECPPLSNFPPLSSPSSGLWVAEPPPHPAPPPEWQVFHSVLSAIYVSPIPIPIPTPAWEPRAAAGSCSPTAHRRWQQTQATLEITLCTPAPGMQGVWTWSHSVPPPLGGLWEPWAGSLASGSLHESKATPSEKDGAQSRVCSLLSDCTSRPRLLTFMNTLLQRPKGTIPMWKQSLHQTGGSYAFLPIF